MPAQSEVYIEALVARLVPPTRLLCVDQIHWYTFVQRMCSAGFIPESIIVTWML